MVQKSLAEQLEECTERCRNMSAPLAERLASFAADVRVLNPDFADVVDRMVERLTEAGAGENAPKPGEPMPDFVLPDQDGRLISLTELLDRGPLVIAFHRGHWCPYCRISASALTEVHDDIRALGGELVAITPEVERFNAELKSAVQADFPVLSDMDNGYALLLNLAFYVGDEKQRFMQAAGWTIPPYQLNDNWTLPIPATFVVDQKARVAARFIDPDYRKRMDIADILGALEALQRS